jgi:hypothetical protein
LPIANSLLNITNNNKDLNNINLATNFVQDYSTNIQTNSVSKGTILDFKQPTE